MNETSTMTAFGRQSAFQALAAENHLLNRFNGHNRLLAAAFPLIQLFTYLRNHQNDFVTAELQNVIIAEINLFANQAKAFQCPPQLILAAQYCLCTALDEAILLTPWGSQSGWAQQSLLSLIHHETWGGERFFIILEKMAVDPKKNLPLLELLYLLLALGFEGKFYSEDRMLKEELQHRLYQLISTYQAESSLHLSPSIYQDEKPLSAHTKGISHKKFFMNIFGVILGIGILLNIALYFKAKPFLQELSNINTGQHAFLIKQADSNPIVHKSHRRHHRDTQS